MSVLPFMLSYPGLGSPFPGIASVYRLSSGPIPLYIHQPLHHHHITSCLPHTVPQPVSLPVPVDIQHSPFFSYSSSTSSCVTLSFQKNLSIFLMSAYQRAVTSSLLLPSVSKLLSRIGARSKLKSEDKMCIRDRYCLVPILSLPVFLSGEVHMCCWLTIVASCWPVSYTHLVPTALCVVQ